MTMFPTTPSITLRDPLAELLGAGEEPFTYTFADAVKLAGHACPTVAGAFLMTKRALEILYPDGLPERGDVAIEVPGRMDEGVTGPITQIFTLVTGAAADNGFHGLGGQFSRLRLMRFGNTPNSGGPFLFRRLSTGRQVEVSYSPRHFPPDPHMGELLPRILGGQATPEDRRAFGDLWRDRVLAILKDAGEHTVITRER
ncbi:MAG: hypothetical protein HQL96_15430 [Magnetococcales bacterium]|nr:hypothetical protein [Magnetococcales bacterium]